MSKNNEIPTAEQIRSLGKPATEDLTKFLEFSRGAIGRFITENAQTLIDGGTITFHFPTLRDGGKLKGQWEKHHAMLSTEVADKGYDVHTRTSFSIKGVGLEIKLPQVNRA